MLGGADVNKADGFGKTALVIAAKKGDGECLKQLIAAGADINRQDQFGHTALMSATENGHVKCVKELIDAGVKVNEKDNHGFTALSLASKNRHTDCLRELLKAGAELNADLHSAVKRGQVNFARKLINEGANVNSEDTEKRTALMIAAESGHVQCV